MPLTIRSLLLGSALWLLPANASESPQSYQDFNKPPHNYKTRAPQDRFTLRMAEIEKDPRLDRSSEKAFLTSFLDLLGVPPSSQLLVFSTTSLQLRFINPANPRALYFSEDIYVGYIPGGRLEIIGIDPELGAIFYIFDIPRADAPIRFERSDRCMNCHAAEDTGFVPGLVVKSVVPGPSGGSLDAFRVGQSGHTIPLSERFGGWHVTGNPKFTNHWGNITGRYVEGEIRAIPNNPGERFSWAKYPVETSDILAHLLHEHQAGFINRAVEAGYRARTIEFLGSGKLTPEQERELDQQARLLAKYILFADEAPLPPGGLEVDPEFKNAFLARRVATSDGKSLRDLNLRDRLFTHRCSYMIDSAAFTGLPPAFKARVYTQLKSALTDAGDKDFDYLPQAEKEAILRILRSTNKDLPAGW